MCRYKPSEATYRALYGPSSSRQFQNWFQGGAIAASLRKAGAILGTGMSDNKIVVQRKWGGYGTICEQDTGLFPV